MIFFPLVSFNDSINTEYLFSNSISYSSFILFVCKNILIKISINTATAAMNTITDMHAEILAKY